MPVLIDAITGNSVTSGTDIKSVKAAVDSTKQKMYVYMEIANGDIDSLYVYAFYFIESGLRKQVYSRYDTTWTVYGQDDITTSPISMTGNDVFVYGEYIEFSFDIANLVLPQYFYISANVYDGSGGDDFDVAELDTLVTIPY